MTYMKRLWQDSFWRNNVIFFGFSGVIALLNYLYYPVLGRVMDVRHFGEMQLVISMVNISGMFVGALQILIVNLSANPVKKGEATTKKVVQAFEQLSLGVTLVLAAVCAASAVLLQRFFSFDSAWPFVIFSFVMVSGVVFAFRRGHMQGLQRFGVVSASGMLLASAKLFLSAALVYVGLKTIGAIGGLLLAQLLAMFFIVRQAAAHGYNRPSFSQLHTFRFAVIRPYIPYARTVVTVSFVLTLLISGDILIVKRYFSPETAGLYAGVSTVAKIIFFATSPLSEVLLASVGPAHTLHHNIATVRKSLLLCLGVGGLLLICFSAFPSEIVTTLMGKRYAPYATLLPWLSVGMMTSSLSYMAMYFLLAIRSKAALYLALTATFGGALLAIFRHSTLTAVVSNLIITSGGMLVLILFVAVRSTMKQRKMELAP